MFRRKLVQWPNNALLGAYPSNPVSGSNIAFDLDFTTGVYLGGTMPEGANTGNLFRQQIVNTFPSYMENLDGSLKTFSVASSVRRTTKGLVSDGQSRTNKAKNSRDLTNATWVKTNCTAAKNQTGRTGVANSASTLTATSSAATCLGSYVLAAQQDMNAFFDVKRTNGTGTLEWTYDGGATWRAVNVDAAPAIFNGWKRVQVATQAAMVAATYDLGFRIATSGDAFAIDFVDGNEIATEYSPINAGAASVKGWFDRPSAYDTFNSPLQAYLANNAVRCAYAEFAFRVAGGIITASGGTILNVRLTDCQAFGGTVTTGNAPTQATTPRLTELNKVMCWQTATQTGICLNGGTIVTASGAAPGAGDHWDLLTNGSASASIDGRCTRLIFFNSVPSNSFIQSFTT